MKQRILITGGSGFVGQNVIQELLTQALPYEIWNLSRERLADLKIVHIPCEDAASFDFKNITEQFDFIVHTLALSNDAHCKDFEYAEKVNIDFTKKLIAFALKQKGLKRFVHISSIILYDNVNHSPVAENGVLNLHYNNYGFTKGIAEYYVNHYREKFNLPAVIFRLSNIYGPHQKYINSPFLVPSKIVQALTEGSIQVFNLSPKRDWIYSRDAARAIVKAFDAEVTGIFNLGSGEGVSVKELMAEISEELNVPITSLEKPTSGPLDFYCNIDKTKEAFSWKPETNLHDGMKQTIDYIKNGLTKI